MTTEQSKIRNIAIIAHVDHGKTTLVDELFKNTGLFRENQEVAERLMDSMDQEKERGITIMAKNGSFLYKDNLINIIDTPGHADFGGQVERVLRMADGCLLLVDAVEGPMPQTYFVLKKALALSLPVIVVINKIDRPRSRPEWCVDQVFDIFVKLHAPDHILDFPVVYASAKQGWSSLDPKERQGDMRPLLDTILARVPPPPGDGQGPLQMLVSSLDYSSFLGRLGIGKISSGSIKIGKDVAVYRGDERRFQARITKIYRFEGPEKVEAQEGVCGDIVAVSGMEDLTVGDTLTDPLTPLPLPGLKIDPPTLSMNFIPNDSPFAGREGTYVTSRHVRERLYREILSDIALKVEDLGGSEGFKVSGRGELHLSVLIEKMRREGYELQVTRPQVIFREENGKTLEPYEELLLDLDEKAMGSIVENLGRRKGEMLDMSQENGMARLRYKIPTRGLLGFRSEFLTLTRGLGVMNYIFLEYGPYAGDMRNRRSGVLIAQEEGVTMGFALDNLQNRGTLFMGPGEKVYEGMIIGENSRDSDMVVNPSKEKKQSNMRSKSADAAIVLTPPTLLSLEQCLAFINDDELVEVTPKNIRLRKKFRDENERKRMQITAEQASGVFR